MTLVKAKARSYKTFYSTGVTYDHQNIFIVQATGQFPIFKHFLFNGYDKFTANT